MLISGQFKKIKRIRSQNISVMVFCIALLFLLSLCFFVFSALSFISNEESDTREAQLRDKEYSNSQVNEDLYTNPDIQKYGQWIREKGAKQAYEDFKIYVRTEFDIGPRHTHAHYFGDAVFLEEGINGIIVCDNLFDYGCHHGLLGGLIVRRGIGSLYQLNKSCHYDNVSINDSAACLHGTGHGLLAYFGYTDEGLNMALEICEKVFDGSYNISVRERCHSGVFMEYNQRGMLRLTEKIGARRQLEDDLYYPCIYFDNDYIFQKTCWLELSFWWSSVLPEQNIEDRHIKAVSLCEGIPEEKSVWIEECARGVGSSALVNYGVPEDLYRICSFFQKEIHKIGCIDGGFVWFAKFDMLKAEGVHWCNNLAPDYYKNECLRRLENYYIVVPPII